MPRIKKIKFQDNGKVYHDTTFTGYITLELMYDAKGECFYFELSDIMENIKSLEGKDDLRLKGINFSRCKTQSQAIEIIETLINKTILDGAERYLGITVSTDNESFGNGSFNRIHGNRSQNQGGLLIGYSHYLKVTYPKTGNVIMTECNRNWTISGHSLHDYSNRLEFIKWTEERQAVLDKAINELGILGGGIQKMFKEGFENGNIEAILDNSGLNLIDKK